MVWRGNRRKPFVMDIRIELSCGHVISARTGPMNATGRYGCTAGLRCGYNLPWLSWWVDGRPETRKMNLKYVKEKEREDGESC